jgi:peptide/nickel transport system substrate-binding protein
VRRGAVTLGALALITAACGSDDDGGGAETGSENPASVSTLADVEEGQIETGDIITDEPVTEEPAGEGSESGGEEQPDEEPAVADPVRGGTLRYALEADVDGLNPATSNLSSPGLMMVGTVMDTLAAFDTDGRAVPYLAESFTPNDDFTSWDVRLRPGVSFHDGSPLDAAALKFNFDTQQQDPIVGLAIRPFFPDDGAVEIVDDLTVRYNLLEANAYFPGSLATQVGFVASPTWLAAAIADPTLNQQPVGTGPFAFDSRSQDSVTRFVRNETWWNGEVWLDAIEYLPITDPDVRSDLLVAGDIEALQTSDPGSVQKLTEIDNLQNLLDETGEENFWMINSSAAPFDDIRARQALALASPRTSYQTLIALGLNRFADQRFIPESKFYNPDVRQVGDEPDAARPLVDDYCSDNPQNCSDGAINMEYQWSGPSVVGTRTADLFEQGVDGLFNMTRQEIPQDDHIAEVITGQYNVVAWRQFGEVDPAQANMWLLCRTAEGLALNFPRSCDEERDALLLQAQATPDEAERIALYQQAEALINEEYVYIFTVHTIWDNAFGANVRGVCDRVSPEGTPLRCAVRGWTFPSSVWLAE